MPRTRSQCTIATNIRRAREAVGLSQRQAALAAGIEPIEWSRFEAGHRLPRLGRLARIAEALGVTIAALTHGVDQSLRP